MIDMDILPKSELSIDLVPTRDPHFTCIEYLGIKLEDYALWKRYRMHPLGALIIMEHDQT